MIPTVGFNMRKVTKGNVTIKLWDIGGQPRFRSMWERYCRGVSAIVYMVDAAEPGKLESAKQELHALLAKEQLGIVHLAVLLRIDCRSAGSCIREAFRLIFWSLLPLPCTAGGIPVLVLGNKNDLPNAIGVEQLIEMLGLKEIQDREVCCYSISCKSQVNIGMLLLNLFYGYPTWIRVPNLLIDVPLACQR